MDMELDTSGVQVTLIDFTLSRLSTLLGRTAFNDLAADPALFAGPKGDVQVRQALFYSSNSLLLSCCARARSDARHPH